MKIRFLLNKTLFLFVNQLYNSLQSIANQKLAKSFFQHFKVIYPDVRSMIVGHLVENITVFMEILIKINHCKTYTMIKVSLKKPYFSFLFSLRRKHNYHDTNPYSLIIWKLNIKICIRTLFLQLFTDFLWFWKRTDNVLKNTWLG